MAEKLPDDNQTLLIVNCSKSWQEVVAEGVYICPAAGGAYNHHPTRYFGVYHDKKVSHVANIEAVVDVNPDDSTTVRWLVWPVKEADFRKKAVAGANRLRPKNEFPVRVFLLGPLQATNFNKDTHGGMQNSARYYDVSSLGVSTAGFLAHKLSGKKWSDFMNIEVNEQYSSYKGMYETLQKWFAAQAKTETELHVTFRKLEEAGSVLFPPSAREYQAWWLDKSPDTTHSHARAWLETGWQVESVNLSKETVSFKRV
ncbi:MAG TPA: hypothetical protein VH186_21975 [Chloroflexia bacterium]|nr:hypothetical protein [Chloroflexia bacterium]